MRFQRNDGWVSRDGRYVVYIWNDVERMLTGYQYECRDSNDLYIVYVSLNPESGIEVRLHETHFTQYTQGDKLTHEPGSLPDPEKDRVVTSFNPLP